MSDEEHVFPMAATEFRTRDKAAWTRAPKKMCTGMRLDSHWQSGNVFRRALAGLSCF